jgi:hypothetical protein
MISTAADTFKGEPFLLHVNKWVKQTSTKLPPNATVVPVDLRGLNAYKDFQGLASLAITHPEPGIASWMQDFLAMPLGDIYHAYRIHRIYQAVGRILRDRADHRIRTVLVPGYDDARFLHELYEGSEFLGQIGSLPPLEARAREERVAEKARGEPVTHEGRLRQYLKTLPGECVSVREVQRALQIPPTSWKRISSSLRDPSSDIAEFLRTTGLRYETSRGRGFNGFRKTIGQAD